MIKEFRGKYFFLSNYFDSPIPCELLNGEVMVAQTVEHYFHAKKPTNVDQQKRILTSTTPGSAKRLGRTCTLRKDWEEVKIKVMENALRLKFADPHLKDLLLATGDKELIEGNTWNDQFWGVCNGVGENNLGKLLMKLRKEYSEGK